MSDQLLRVPEVARLLSTSPGTIRAMIERGELRGVRLSRRVIRIPRSAVERILVLLDGNAETRSRTQKPSENTTARAKPPGAA